jgi:hypothetical protein
MMAHPLAPQLRNLPTLVEIGVDKSSTIVFPSPLMSTIQELGAVLSCGTAAHASRRPSRGAVVIPVLAVGRGRAVPPPETGPTPQSIPCAVSAVASLR